MICRTFRALTFLAADALEALIYLCPFDDIADELWAKDQTPTVKGLWVECERCGELTAEEHVQPCVNCQWANASSPAHDPTPAIASVQCQECDAEIAVPAQPFTHRVVGGPCPGCGAKLDVKLEAQSSSPAHGSAGDEPSGGSVPPPDVEPPLGFQGLSARDLRGAAYAVGIYAERYSQVATNTAWVGLAERLKSAADAM